MTTLPLFPDETEVGVQTSSEQAPYTVTFVTGYIKRKLDEDYNLQSVWIEGEVSNLSRPSSGHMYFTLKDADAQLRCVMWRSDAERLGFDLDDHERVLAQGNISVYDRGGQYQLYVRRLHPLGAGDLNRQLQLLYNRLQAEGLFEPGLKQPVPALPLKIGVVTSPSTAAWQDVLNVLRRRLPLAEVTLSPTLVQGEAAPAQIVAALEALNRQQNVDVILLVRGGGSLEDLWCFNDERVVRAVVESSIPVVSGVGHEVDHMLVDYAADMRAPTPSAAAEVVAPDMRGLQQSIDGLRDRAYNALATKFEVLRNDLANQHRALRHLSPQDTIVSARQRTDDISGRLNRGIQARILNFQQALARQQTALQGNDPQGLLARGYAIVTRAGDNKRINNVGQAATGTSLIIQLADGTLHVSVRGRTTDKPPLQPPGQQAHSSASDDRPAAVV